MQFPQFVLSSSCERENEYEDHGGDIIDGNLNNSNDGAGPPHRRPLPGSAAAVSSTDADLWMQPWLEYHGSFGGYTCHLCQRSRLEGPQAVRFHVQEPFHQNNVEQLQRDRRQASILLQRWNLIHRSPDRTGTSASSSLPASVEEQQSSSSLLRTANRLHNDNRHPNFILRATGATPLGRRNGRTAAATIGMDESSLLLVRIDCLGLPAWRDAVQASLFRYLSLQDEGNDDNSLQPAYRILNKYEHWERIALLELAVWKAICLVKMPAEACTDYYAAKKWLDSGWKTLKSAQRQSNAVDIVLSRVVPFLDRHSSDEHEQSCNPTTIAEAAAVSFVPGETARPRRRFIHQRRLRFHNQLPVPAAMWRGNNNNSAVDYLRGASRRLVRVPGHLPDYLPHNDEDDDDAGAGGEDDYDFDGFPTWAQDM